MQIKKRTFSTQGQNQDSMQSQQSEYIKLAQDQNQTQYQGMQNAITKNSSLESNVQSININNNSNQVNNLLYKISILSPIKKHPMNRKNIYYKQNEQNYYEEMISPLGQQHMSHFSNQSSIHNLSLDDGSLLQNKNIQNINFLESDLSSESNNNSQLFSSVKFDILENRQLSQGKKSEMLSRQRKQVIGKYPNQLPSIQGSNNSIDISMIQTRKQSGQTNMQTPLKIQKMNQNGFKNQQNLNGKKIIPLFNQNTNSTSNNSNVMTQDNDISNQKINNQDKNINHFSIIDNQNQYNPAAGMYGTKARKLIDLTDIPQINSKNNIRHSSQNSKENSLNNSMSGQQFLKSNNNIFNSGYKQPQITYQAVYGSENDLFDIQDKMSIHTPVKQSPHFQSESISYESFSQTPEVKSSSLRNQTKFERVMESQISQTVSLNKNCEEIKQQMSIQSQRQVGNNIYNKNQIPKINSEQQQQIKILKNKSNNNQTNLQNKQIQVVKQTKNPKHISTEGGVNSENDTQIQKIKGDQSAGAMTSSNIASKKNSLVLVKQSNNKLRNNAKVIRINQIQNMTELFPENTQNVAHSQIVIKDGKIIQKELNSNQKQVNSSSSQNIKSESNQTAAQNNNNNNNGQQQNLESNYVTFKDIPVANSCDPTLYRISVQSQMVNQKDNLVKNSQLSNSNGNLSEQSTSNVQEKQSFIQSQSDQDIKEEYMRNSGGNINSMGCTKDEIEYTKDGIEIYKSKNLSSCFSNSALSQCSIQTVGSMSRKKINLTMLVAYGEQLCKLNEIFQEFEVQSSPNKHLTDNPIFLQNLLQKCHWFLDIINTEKDLEQLPLLFKDEKSRKIIKQSMVFERCVIVMIAQNLLDKDVFNSNYKYLKGIVYYAYQNYINTISIIHHKMSNQLTFSKLNIHSQNQSNAMKNSRSGQFQNDQSYAAANNSNLLNNPTISTIHNTNTLSTCLNQEDKLNRVNKNQIEYNEDDEEIDPYTKQQFMKLVRRQSMHITPNASPQRPQQKWVVTLLNQIRQNNEISINSFKNISKNDKEFYSYMLNFIKNIDRSNSVNQIYNTMLQYFSLYLIQKYQQMDTPLHFSIPFLSTAPAPYLPEMDKKHNYTLVLDLDETLIHYTEAYNNVKQFVVRPYVQTFLHQISEFYEIVVFTAGMPDYANWVIDNFDTKGFIKYRLYRQHTLQIQNTYIKDLSRIGRDLSKVIIIDNLAENFQFQPDNGIFIRAWTEDPTDTALAELLPLLKEIAVKKSEDVRVALKILKEQIQKNIEEGIEFPHLNLKL